MSPIEIEWKQHFLYICKKADSYIIVRLDLQLLYVMEDRRA